VITHFRRINQPRAGRIAASENAESIMFDFMQPTGTARRGLSVAADHILRTPGTNRAAPHTENVEPRRMDCIKQAPDRSGVTSMCRRCFTLHGVVFKIMRWTPSLCSASFDFADANRTYLDGVWKSCGKAVLAIANFAKSRSRRSPPAIGGLPTCRRAIDGAVVLTTHLMITAATSGWSKLLTAGWPTTDTLFLFVH
jgi:hypothetical protein